MKRFKENIIMSETMIVDALDQLKPFLNDKKVLEIVVRTKNKRIKTFQKIALNELSRTENKEMLEKVVQSLNKNTAANERTIRLLANVAKSQKMDLLLNSLNLCSTCVGFAVMSMKLESMREEINQQLLKLQNVVKQGNDVHTGYEFNKVLSDHTDMLDCRKKQQPYSEEKMRELVDREYNVLSLLISVFQKQLSSDNKELIFTIFSLLSMLTVSIMYFDEIYYENNHGVLGNENTWHSSHEKWMSIYSTLRSEWFIEKLQDYGVFESGLTTLEVDAFCIGLLDQVIDKKQDVEDNQSLILALGDIKLLHTLNNITTQDVKDSIREAFKEAYSGNDSSEMEKAYNNALKQAVSV